MNFLAHIYLARHSDAAMVGALLGDFAKADVSGRYPPEVVREIVLHRRIDAFTDNHAIFRQGVALFAPGRRRYAGIVLDVFYDHLLSQRWARYTGEPREALIARFYQALLAHAPLLPDKLREIAPWMVEQDWLGSYLELEGVELAVRRISQRLSRNGYLLREGLDDVRANYDALATGFEVFFPELVTFAERERVALIQAEGPAERV
ncbi:ACP phosphodiesterase [Chitinimonas sp.]|uniref:acyl carrier protein phosphodiesterase n=1 Tax=Chitinimonas sp. TaxID=1934313 RepID=UPI002F93424D